MVELSLKQDVSVAELAREHGINDNLLFKWRQYWREGMRRSSQQSDTNMPALLPVTLDAEIKQASYLNCEKIYLFACHFGWSLHRLRLAVLV
ncbi:transposase [Budvicia aquatica]|uniref:Transposase n=1 Tax=Budvicia aquatica TaxID=82979 RepID=A0A2C6DKX7_9GAMM|nr:transposase [Budvicia aquatica]PHI30968.1 hypothetical protein CRN84_17320 [Budvicia aquatica]